MDRLFREIRDELFKIPAIDTHEHLRYGHMIDFATLGETPVEFKVGLREVIIGSYMGYILNTAAPGARVKNLDDRESFLKVLRSSSNTTSYRCGVEIPLRDLYGFDASKLDEGTWNELERDVADRYKSGPWVWTREVFHRANIEKALKINVSPSYYKETIPSLAPGDREIEESLLVGVGAVDFFLLHKPDRTEQTPTQESYRDLAKQHGVSLDDLDGFVALIDKVVGEYKSLGACALKSSAAYQRTLRVEQVTVEEAASLYGMENRAMSPEEQKRFGDFAWIEIARAAGRHDLPFIIHTGLVPGSSHLLLECNPAFLKGLITNPELSETKFVLIHTGYPYARETVHIAWDIPNVWIDFVWLPTLSIEAGAQVLGEFLDWVPANKFVIGGDFEMPEGVYGAMYQCREVLAMVLARKVRWKIWSISQAIDIGRRVLRDNALDLFRVQ